MRVFGVTLVGVSTTTGVKLLFTVGLVLAVLAVLAVLVVRGLALAATRRLLGGDVGDPRRFWARRGVQVVTAVVLLLGPCRSGLLRRPT